MAVTMKLRVGLFGAGVVGGGVCELIQRYVTRAGLSSAGIEIVTVCVKSIDRVRDFKDCDKYKYVTDFNEILNDSSINCVVELIGGTTDAKDIVFQSLRNGKYVVSANKALIANYLSEIQEILANHPNSKFCYEAAVCGGIPIINALQTDFVSDNITKVMGIMNGTTNFMLCKMEDEGADYSAVLAEAQRLGYAEADPTADVEGHDVQAKIALLAKLGFGKSVPFASIPTTGISKISSADFEFAKMLNCTVKLVGTAMVSSSSTSTTGSSIGSSRDLAVFVSPTLVPLSSPLATAKGPGNMVVINSENMGVTTLAGPGAGRYPTANSVLNDLVRLHQGQASPAFPLNQETELEINNNYQARFYMRVTCFDRLGIVRAVGAAAETANVSIHAIHRQPANTTSSNSGSMDFVVVTEVVSREAVQVFAQEIAQQPFAKEFPVFMPML